MSEGFPYLGEHQRVAFPSPREAGAEGLVAAGGNLSPGVLLSAYTQGIFPWYSDGEPILWWSPDPRFVLFPEELHIPKSLRRTLNRGRFAFTLDRAFDEVIAACSVAPRSGQAGTWITDDMIEGYETLNTLGYAHSLEVWAEGKLAGGLYGVSLGGMFFGESMFARVSDASKAGFVTLVRVLSERGFDCVDCQMYTEHLDRFGARDMARDEFLELLAGSLERPTVKGDWQAELGDHPRFGGP
ncbi:MAG: leucyl/phenylalanyl-tRNA--protein transferase [Spirochaetes bacterium]|jgi:leucyl/phenylalanyl-tRNA--protein transferase|nr:leucyl/phenylalanyl-tRNA--protein transferase [Spirochaetota bacterium]